MADVILFHHAHGITTGVEAFADGLRAAGHRVTVPDLFEGMRFDTVDEGVAHADTVGFETIIERGVAAAAGFAEQAVYVGFSLGVMPAQKLAMTRPGALAAVMFHSAAPSSFFGAWPAGVALQIHINDEDPWDDLPVAEELVAEVEGAELFVYPGTTHLFTDNSLDDHIADSADLAMQRTLDLLSRWP